jgi:hypothetical protein
MLNLVSPARGKWCLRSLSAPKKENEDENCKMRSHSSPDIIRLQGEMGQACSMREEEKACTDFVGRSEGIRSIGRLKYSWEVNIVT